MHASDTLEQRKIKQLKKALEQSELRVNNLRVDIQALQAELRLTREEATRRVRSVQSFWKDKIYSESS